MKTIFRLLCGWMAIALAACTGDELQQIEPLQKPVAQKTISVKAYTPSEQAATRLDFTEEDDGSLSLAWTADDAFTAVIDNNKVRFEYDEDSKEFTANVAQDVTLTDGLKAYYPAYEDEYTNDFSRQTGQLNGATTYMEGVYEGDAFKFTHSTAILKASFDGLHDGATISSVGIDVVAGENSFQIAISQPADSLYINLPAIANGGKLKFDVRTSDGTLYTATKTVTAEEGIKTGVYYNTTVELQEACLLPTGGEFKSAIRAVNGYENATSIVFEANVADETPATRSDSNYTIALADNVLTISTPLSEFVFNKNCNGMFSYLTNIQSIDFGNCVNTANVIDMGNMFNTCSSLTSLDLSSFNTEKVIVMFFMFQDCSSLTSLDLSSFNTSKVTTMNYMFCRCSSLTSLDLSSFNTANVMFMNYMFNNCSSLTSLDLSNFNTSNVTKMFNMFDGCSKLTSLNVSSFNTEKVTDMGYMFNNCSSLTSLDLSSFNTEKVTNMASMFYDCSELNSLNVSSFNTTNVTDMSSMFYNCESLNSLNVSSFNTANVTDMSYMFNYCQKLTSLDLSNFNTEKVTNMASMFFNCESLSSLDLCSFNFDGVQNLGGAQNYYQMFYCLGEKAAKRPIPVYVTLAGYEILSKKSTGIDDSYAKYMVLCELPTGNSFNSVVKPFLNDKSLTKIKFVANSSNTNTSKPISSISGAYMVAGSNNTLEIHTSAAGFLFNEDSNHMFSSLSAITAINFNNSVNTAKVTNMAYMFYDCKSLSSLNVGNFNTANVTDMSYMFNNCSSLTSLDLSNFNTSNVTDMKYMFNDCSLLTSLDLSSFNTAKVTNMASMFSDCQKLTSLNVSNFNTANVTDMSSMFSYCKTLTSLDLSSFNTANVVNMDDMFDSCYALTSLDLSNFNTANVEQMSYMFNFCSELTSLDLSSFNTANVIFMNDMFNSCSSLTSLNVSNFNTANVENMSSMFSYCQKLASLDLSRFVFNENVVLTNMFFDLGANAANKPIPVYAKSEYVGMLNTSASTGIKPYYAFVQVKQP